MYTFEKELLRRMVNFLECEKERILHEMTTVDHETLEKLREMMCDYYKSKSDLDDKLISANTTLESLVNEYVVECKKVLESYAFDKQGDYESTLNTLAERYKSQFLSVLGEYESFAEAAAQIATDKADEVIAQRVAEVGNITQTMGHSTTAVMSQNAVTEIFEEITGVKLLSTSDFVNGYFQLGTGIVTNTTDADYSIINRNPIRVCVGNRITIKPNGLRVWGLLESVNDLSLVQTHLKNLETVTTDTEYISEFDGYLFVQINTTSGNRIAPNDYACEISVYEENNDQSFDLESTLVSSPKRCGRTIIVNDCQDTTKWVISNENGVASVDTANFIAGHQSLRCNKQMSCSKDKYDFLNNDIVLKIKINSIAQNARLQLRVGHASGGGLLVYEFARGSTWTTPSDWVEVVIPHTAYAYGNTELDFANIDFIYVMSSEGAVDWNLQYIGLRPKKLKKGIVTFTFDDGYKSQYTGLKLLAEKGITGTLFHIKEATETGYPDYLTVGDLQKLVNYYNADIEVHGDPSYDQWNETDLANHWKNSQEWLKANGLGEGKHMAYPNGIFPENVVQLAKAYFDSCRTIIPFVPLETYPPADRYRIRAVSGVGAGGVTVDTVKTYIDKAMEDRAWLILVFHKIGSGGTDSMWCTENDLTAIADYAIESGAEIMNYAEVFESSVLN